MTSDDYAHFVCIVAGEEPDKMMDKYLERVEETPHVVYKYADANKIKTYYTQTLKKIMENKHVELSTLDTKSIEYSKLSLEISMDELAYNDANSKTDDEFFADFTSDYEHDEKTGDAISKESKDGKFTIYNIGNVLSVPFIKKDGSETFSCLKGEIDWSKLHRHGEDTYKRVWELIMERADVKTEEDQLLYNNMFDKVGYLQKFETKENYIASCTSFWAYAFLSDITGWIELEPNINQFEWMNNYYERFIEPLENDVKLTIYECRKY